MIGGLPLSHLLRQQTEQRPDKPFLTVQGQTMTFSQTQRRNEAFSHHLREHGVCKGTRIAIWSDSKLLLAEALLACWRIGAVAVPVDPQMKGDQLRRRIGLVDAFAVICDKSHQIEDLSAYVRIINPSFDVHSTSSLEYPVALPEDTGAILFTSGTTGFAKGVCCSHEQLLCWAHHHVEYLQITDNDRLYTCLPLHHVNAIGAFLAALVAGASIVLGPRITISRFWEELAEARATVTYLLGPMVKMLWNRSAVKAETEHCARIALAPGTPAELFNSFEERFGLELMEAYGSTETNWVIGCVRGEQRPGYMGKVIEGFDARVIDERGHLVEDGSPGQLVLRPHRRFEFFTEYFRDPSYTNSRWIDGWFYTGDLVYREAADGYFRFIGRIGDTIRRLGENIVPTEVENALEAHPEVAEAAVFGVPSEFGEEEIMACVVPSHREKLDIQSLIVWCSGKLAPHSIPRYFEMLTELPRTSTGRIQKHLLRELGVTSQTYDRRTDT